MFVVFAAAFAAFPPGRLRFGLLCLLFLRRFCGLPPWTSAIWAPVLVVVAAVLRGLPPWTSAIWTPVFVVFAAVLAAFPPGRLRFELLFLSFW